MAPRLLLLTAGSTDTLPAGAGFGREDEQYLARYTTDQLLHRRARFLLARGLALCAHVRRQASILCSGRGKLVLSLPEFSFSFSYTQKPFCLLCQTEARQAPDIGLDCIALRTCFLPPLRFFSPEEEALLRIISAHTDNAGLQRELLRRFCIYEAVCKAHGTGLAHIPKTLHAGAGWQRRGEAVIEDRVYAWRLLALEHTYVCLAIDSRDRELLDRLEVHRL